MAARKCPKCGHNFSGYDKARDQRNLELGRCVDCQKDKSDADIEAGRWRCQACRRKRALRMQRRRVTADVMAAARVSRPSLSPRSFR